MGADEWLEIPLPPGGYAEIRISLSVGSQVDIGTSLELMISASGGENDVGTPYLITDSTTLNVAVRRDVNAHVEYDENLLTQGEAFDFTIVIESRSSVEETVYLEFGLNPSNLDMICDTQQLLSEEILTRIIPKPDSTGVKNITVVCQTISDSGDNKGTIILELSGGEGNTTLLENTLLIEWDKLSETSENSKGIMGIGIKETIIGASAVVLLMIIILLSLAIRRDRDDEDISENILKETVALTTSNYENWNANAQAQQQQVAQAQQQIQPNFIQTIAVPKQSNWTDDQLIAAGWTQEQIVKHREPMTETSPTTTDYHTQTSTQPLLSTAFDSLGFTETVTSDVSEDEITQDKESNVLKQTHENNLDKDSATLPVMNCVITGGVLSLTNKWFQCPSCGGYADMDAKLGVTHCPRCKSQW